MTSPFPALLLIVLSAPVESAPWRDRQTVDGLLVQDRDVPGLAYKQLRISAVIPQDVASLCHAVLAEESARPEGRFKKRELLRRPQPSAGSMRRFRCRSCETATT